MANVLFVKGFEGLIDGTLDLDTNTIKDVLLDIGTTDVGIKTITGCTTASPPVVTSASHGFSNGDYVAILNVAGCPEANGVWKIANVATNTFELQRPDGTNATTLGTYTSGGTAINLGPGTSGDNLDDFDAARVGTDQTLTSPTVTSGTFDAADPTHTAVTGASVEAIALYKDTGVASTSRMIALFTGNHIVTIAKDVAASDTTVWVEPLAAAIASAVVLSFSNGRSLTLNGSASAGARSITVNSAANSITAGNRALAPATGSGLPVTPNGGNITVQFDSGTYKIFSIFKL